MDRAADLDAVLVFIIGRIEEEAARSGQPLNEEQRFLLNNLPKSSSLPEVGTGEPESPLVIVPRDTNYEKLCFLARTAHASDLALNPSSTDWEFAFAVSKLNGHPLRWLLQWTGVKQRRPWWDRWLLVLAALVFIVFTIGLMLLTMSDARTPLKWAGFVGGYLALILLTYFATRRIEQRQLEQIIKRYRHSSRFQRTGTY
jgi:hypothetical protein